MPRRRTARCNSVGTASRRSDRGPRPHAEVAEVRVALERHGDRLRPDPIGCPDAVLPVVTLLEQLRDDQIAARVPMPKLPRFEWLSNDMVIDCAQTPSDAPTPYCPLYICWNSFETI